MKLWWLYGCVHTGGYFTLKALGGRPEMGDFAWIGVTLDIGTAVMFAVAAVLAYRAKVPWIALTNTRDT